MAGIGNTVVPIWRAWFAESIDEKALLLIEAQRNEAMWLLPGMIATVFSGYAWAAAANINVVTTGWLVALQVLLAIDIFIFLPLMGVGLRRARMLALQARKQGEITDALRDALADNVPLQHADRRDNPVDGLAPDLPAVLAFDAAPRAIRAHASRGTRCASSWTQPTSRRSGAARAWA